MKEFIVSEANNGYVVRTSKGLYICATLAQVKKLLMSFFEPKDIEVNDPPF